jgi:hypothetical protein
MRIFGLSKAKRTELLARRLDRFFQVHAFWEDGLDA